MVVAIFSHLSNGLLTRHHLCHVHKMALSLLLVGRNSKKKHNQHDVFALLSFCNTSVMLLLCQWRRDWRLSSQYPSSLESGSSVWACRVRVSPDIIHCHADINKVTFNRNTINQLSAALLSSRRRPQEHSLCLLTTLSQLIPVAPGERNESFSVFGHPLFIYINTFKATLQFLV